MSVGEPSMATEYHHWNIAQKLFRHPTERSWILVAPTSLGEIRITCALARSLTKSRDGPLTVDVKSTHAPIAETYSGDINHDVSINGDLTGLCRKIQPCTSRSTWRNYVIVQDQGNTETVDRTARDRSESPPPSRAVSLALYDLFTQASYGQPVPPGGGAPIIDRHSR